jgi:hypothetical protein
MTTSHSVLMQEVNERTYAVLVGQADDGLEDGAFVCECDQIVCFETIQITLGEYAALRPRHEDQLILAPGHKSLGRLVA